MNEWMISRTRDLQSAFGKCVAAGPTLLTPDTQLLHPAPLSPCASVLDYFIDSLFFSLRSIMKNCATTAAVGMGLVMLGSTDGAVRNLQANNFEVSFVTAAAVL